MNWKFWERKPTEQKKVGISDAGIVGASTVLVATGVDEGQQPANSPDSRSNDWRDADSGSSGFDIGGGDSGFGDGGGGGGDGGGGSV